MTPEEVKAVTSAAILIVSLMLWVPLFIGLAIANGYVAARLGKSVALWVILSLIPGYNIIFIYYVWFYVTGRVLNRLNQITDHLGVTTQTAVPS